MAASKLQCIVVTPEQTVRNRPADFVALPLDDGEIGIAPLHSALIGRLGIGELRIRLGTLTDRYYIEGGFVEVLDDVVSVLTSRAIAARDLDEATLQEQLRAAKEQPLMTPEQLTAREHAVALARAQLRVARRARR